MTGTLLGPAATVARSAVARLPGGLRVTAVRLATVPRVEVRLAMPLAPRFTGHAVAADAVTGPVRAARAAVLAACALRGATCADGTRTETALGRAGADLVPTAGADRLALHGGVLAGGLDVLLRAMAAAVSSVTWSEHDVAAARTVLGGQAAVAARQSAASARALLHRHAPGWAGDPQGLPTPELIDAVTSEQVRELHARALVPAPARLVLVGDLDPDAAVGAAREAFAGWTGPAARTPDVPGCPGPPPRPAADFPSGTVGLYPAAREGIAQVLLCAASDDEPLTPALRLAALVFGGHPESRVITRLRERHGYTYAVRSWAESRGAVEPGSRSGGGFPLERGHRLFIGADTAPSKARPLLEGLGDELARMVTDPPSAGEVDRACAHFTGISLIAWSTQAGLADALADPSPQSPADPEQLRELLVALARTPPETVAAAARGAFAPGRFTGVVTGAAPAFGAGRHWRVTTSAE
ncbi:insulinase family protein [Streptomyces sp. NPDC050423]|uniref:M16 family metallopeptidase n=1 Tax=Streptomyces sp. NPDC050423 TaxID=3155402 RepID=UPI003432445D